MFILNNLNSFREKNIFLKIENKLKSLVYFYFFYFFLFLFVLSFFLFIYLKSYLSPKGIRLNLPSSNSNFVISQDFPRAIISLTEFNNLYFDNENNPTDVSQFREKLDKVCDKNENCQIFLMFEKNVIYENVINIISFLRDSNYKYISLITK